MKAEPRLGSKVFYKIGEVSQITQLPSYVLRFWEAEFNFLKPKKSTGGQRLYVQRDIEMILEIKRMLYDEGYTLEGVRRFKSRKMRQSTKQERPQDVAKRLRGNLQAILKLLDSARF